MWDHIAQVCTPFFQGIESQSQYESRQRRQEEEHGCIDASGDHCSPSRGPERRTREQEDRRPKATKPIRSWSKSRHMRNVREWRSCSRKQALSQTLWGGSPRDSSSSQGRKLPTPPRPSRSKTPKETEAWQTAFRDAMDVARSLSMSLEDWVQEEEKLKRRSSTGEDPQPGPSPPPLEGCSVSDVSMADEGLLQRDSDVIIEEERRVWRQMPPLDSTAPAPLKEKAIPEDLEARDDEDHCSQTSEESTDQNPSHNSDPDKDELLGLPTNISNPGGHSDDSIALVVSPGDDNL